MNHRSSGGATLSRNFKHECKKSEVGRVDAEYCKLHVLEWGKHVSDAQRDSAVCPNFSYINT